MSRFKILRIDHYDPVSVGRRNRFIYTIYGVIPFLFLFSINLATQNSEHSSLILFCSLPVMILIVWLLVRKVKSDIRNLKTIGELEITQSGLKKWIGDSLTEYNYQTVKEITLTKHIPATSLKESKNRYFSYIMKIELLDGNEESFVVSDRSIDHNRKLSVLDTLKTLKKLVSFKVSIDV